MLPQLVSAQGNPSKKWPGGIVVVKASSWLGGTRGTLATESDSRSIEGTVVRESQKWSGSYIRDESVSGDAYRGMDDTLILPFADLPLENNMTYWVALSLLIEGDWDPTDSYSFAGSFQAEFRDYVCFLAMHYASDEVTNPTTYMNRLELRFYPRGRSNYTFIGIGNISPIVKTANVMKIRAFSQDTSTIEFLIDEVIFVPYVFSGIKGTPAEWELTDFTFVGGGTGDFTNAVLVDGPDGGDSNGKFTWFPYALDDRMGWSGADGGGDYQKKANEEDSEYLFQLSAVDEYGIRSSVTDQEVSLNAYSINGAEYIPAAMWVNDNFSRTVSGGWHNTPDGFVWHHAYSVPAHFSAYTDGSSGVFRWELPTEFGDQGHGISAALWPLTGFSASTSTIGAYVLCENLIFSGKSSVDTTSGQTYNIVDVGFGRPGGTLFFYAEINLVDKTLSVFNWTTTTPVYGPVDISSIYSGDGDVIAWKVQLHRFRFRIRLWNASSSEPTTWNYDDWKRVSKATSPFYLDYPYGDDAHKAYNIGSSLRYTPVIQSSANHPGPAAWSQVHHQYHDDIKVEYEPNGDISDVYAAIERPDGTSLGTIQVPSGAWQLVYWGSADWTDLDSFDYPVLVFSAKTWNGPSAAELQRAEFPWIYFRSVHSKPIDLARVRFRAHQIGDI